MRWVFTAIVSALFATSQISCTGAATGGTEGTGGTSHKAYVVDIKDNIWKDVAAFEIPNEDTLSLRDLSIFIKHQPYERLDSLQMTIYTVSPDEINLCEEVTFKIEGCRRGVSVAGHTHEMPYRSDIKFTQKGVYKMYIFPAAPIAGVEGVGVTIK